MMDSLEIIAACDLVVGWYSKTKRVNEGIWIFNVKVSLTFAEHNLDIKI